MSALKTCTGGETIVLKAGNYGELNLSSSTIPSFGSQVTIAGESSGAVINGLTASGVSNLKFSGLTFDYEAPAGAPLWNCPFSVRACSNIAFSNNSFDGAPASGLGTVDDGYGSGNGLHVLSSSGVTVDGNSFTNFYRGAVFLESSNIVVSRNDIGGIASDGLDFSDVDGVVIKGNHIHDFKADTTSTAHADMIQFWTSGTTSPSTNITISDNYLDAGSGIWTQSIFMRNEVVDQGLAGSEMNYQNVTISNNVIVNGHAHGITVGEATGVVIDNNTLIQQVSAADGGSISLPRINVATAATGVVITDNIVPSSTGTLSTPSSGWTVSNNQIAQRDDADSGTYIGNFFTDALDRTSAGLGDYQLISGTTLDATGAGAHLVPPLAAGEYAGYISSADKSAGGYMVQSFNASNLFTKDGKVDLTGAKIVWNFGDGTAGAGLAVDHVYSKVGLYEATATITLATGKVINVDRTVMVASDRLIDLNFEGTINDTSPSANAAVGTGVTYEAGLTGSAVRLNGSNIAYHADADFSGNSEFTVLADFKKDHATDTGGRLVYFGGAFVITVGQDSLEAMVYTASGTKTLSASQIGLNDTDWHRMALSYSAETGTASLYLDGTKISTMTGLTGINQLSTTADFVVGGAYGGSFTGLIDNVHYVHDSLSNTQLSSSDPLASWAKDAASANTDINSYVQTHPIVSEALPTTTFALI